MKTFTLTILYSTIILMTIICSAKGVKYPHIKDVRHVIVYAQKGRFPAWPANNGAFIFDDNKMLVGFSEGPYKLRKGHNIGEPITSWLARSNDGGESWKAYNPEKFVGDFGDMPKLNELEKPIDFQKPGFVMRIVGTSYHGAMDPRGHFFYSYDTGITWNGPYGFGDLLNHPELKKYDLKELTPRTDYIVTGKNECLLMLSARFKDEFGSDRLFCVKTFDGGQTFHFMGWIVRPYLVKDARDSFKVPLYEDTLKNPYATQCRAVMSQTFKLSDAKLLSVMRRRYTPNSGEDVNWIDAYASVDEGKTWTFQSKVGDAGGENGNPPSLAIMTDGRLCAVFGEREYGTIQVAYSSDEGKTWSKPQILIDEFWSEDMELNDLGYPRVLTRTDGKMVAIFYYSTKEKLHHLRAAIWDPNL